MGAAAVTAIMTSPGQTYAVSIFIESFIQELEISRGLVSTLYTVGTLVGSTALPYVGRMLDKHGGRRLIPIISILFGIACIYMGTVQNAIMLLIGFTLIRMLGQGSLSVSSSYMINQWWVERRGMIQGLSGVLVALLGLGGFPVLLNWMIPEIGWRFTYPLLGGVLILFVAPFAGLLMRDRPEAYDLLPDGRQPDDESESDEDEAGYGANSWTLEEARKTSAFWIVLSGIASVSMLGTGLTFHMVSIVTDRGMSAEVAAAVFIPLAITSAAVNLVGGYLIDRIEPRWILVFALLSQVITLVMAPFLTGITMAYIYGMLLGVLFGAMRTVSSVIFATYFGRQHLGSISGLSSFLLGGASALGPMPFGIARDLFGGYVGVLTISALIPLGLAVAAVRLKRPVKADIA